MAGVASADISTGNVAMISEHQDRKTEPASQTTCWDFVSGNPPFKMSEWGGENLRQDVRWKFGVPPVNNANHAWIQHSIHQLLPADAAGFVMDRTNRSAHSCSMKITEDVHIYAAEQDIAEEEALKKGMEEKSREFTEKGAELYAKA